MPNPHGEFIWYELMTPDPAAARAFYGGLVGWSFDDFCEGGMDYVTFAKNGPEIGGLLELTDEMAARGARPMWTGYIGVDDVDESARAIRAAGGEVILEPQDIPEVGRFALAADPQGVPFYIMRGASDEESRAFSYDVPREGHCAWNELLTPDPAAAMEFYATCFGWTKGDSMEMGPLGTYDFLHNPPRTTMMGAMMRAAADGPPPLWMYYFRVPDIDAAAAYISAEGGTMMTDPLEIPGGEYALNARDPQGAILSLVGKRTG